MMKLTVEQIGDDFVTFTWNQVEDVGIYSIYYADKDTKTMKYKKIAEVDECRFTLNRSTHIPHYIKVVAVSHKNEEFTSDVLKTPVRKVFHPYIEQISRGLIVAKTREGIFLSWRLFISEVTGYTETGLSGTDFIIYKNEKKLTCVGSSTNYLDPVGTMDDIYAVAAYIDGVESIPCESKRAFSTGDNYLEIPLDIPEGGVTPSGEEYTYTANDISVGDVDGDGEYEYIVKWDPTNSHDVSIKGYTGKCYIDCYKLDGQKLWRLDMGVNIRAGAHYTQFMVYDFNKDGKAEIAVKTAPGTKMTFFNNGTIVKESFITMPVEDIEAGYSHSDNYVCTREDYKNHIVKLFLNWQEHPEVKKGQWPDTLESCFGIEEKYTYPLKEEDARELANYFIYEYAPMRSKKNRLDEFEGFIMEGPEYLTMFAGDGSELETILFPTPREDDGLLWGDYAMSRIEPCNRVDRFLSGVAYLDGENPYLIICRGYYTRAAITAYQFFDNHFTEYFKVDSGFVPMENPFCANPHENEGSDPVYGTLAGQGNHSLSAADVDGDGCHEIIYGGAVIDHDGSLLYSSYGYLPDGTYAKFGHGDAMHVADIDPDRPGLEIFNVFEGGKAAPYGFALRDAETGEAIFGEYAEEDLGRCMVGDIDPTKRGLEVWVKETFSCTGEKLSVPLLGTNQSIRWAPDLTTQITDGVDYVGGKHTGIINDNIHGVMFSPVGTKTNNGTKGNPCLVADLFGDFREELVLRTEDNKSLRIYTNTEITKHKLFTLMHDIQYRTGIAWQNNCYNQPAYPSFYYASDMDFRYVLPWLA